MDSTTTPLPDGATFSLLVTLGAQGSSVVAGLRAAIAELAGTSLDGHAVHNLLRSPAGMRAAQAKQDALLALLPDSLGRALLSHLWRGVDAETAAQLQRSVAAEPATVRATWGALVSLLSNRALDSGALTRGQANLLAPDAWQREGLAALTLDFAQSCPNCSAPALLQVEPPASSRGPASWSLKCSTCGYAEHPSPVPSKASEPEFADWLDSVPSAAGDFQASKRRQARTLELLRSECVGLQLRLRQELLARASALREFWSAELPIAIALPGVVLQPKTDLQEGVPPAAADELTALRTSGRTRFESGKSNPGSFRSFWAEELEKVPADRTVLIAAEQPSPAWHWQKQFDGRVKALSEALSRGDAKAACGAAWSLVLGQTQYRLSLPLELRVLPASSASSIAVTPIRQEAPLHTTDDTERQALADFLAQRLSQPGRVLGASEVELLLEEYARLRRSTH